MDKKKLAVFTTRKILSKECTLNLVVHESDGDWQFLNSDEDLAYCEAVVVSMEEILSIDISLNSIVEKLPIDTYAILDSNGKWLIFGQINENSVELYTSK